MAMTRWLPLGATVVALAVGLSPSSAAAAPVNDAPGAAAAFEPYSARHGVPHELQAIADLASATPDPGVPRCLGPDSFERTVWYRVPAAPAPREITVDASGRTVGVPDIALFIQRLDTTVTSTPNACAGVGAGGADAAEDPASAVTVRVPPWRGLLVQVGRRGPAGSPEDEQALVVLREQALEPESPPAGDRAGSRTPKIGRSGSALVTLTGATTTEDEPAQPDCPSLGGVWRRVLPSRSGDRVVTVNGRYASSLAVYRGTRPSLRNAVGCVDREGPGTLVLPVRARAHHSLWIRVGTDRAPTRARARGSIAAARGRVVPSGGGCLAGIDPRVSGALVGRPAPAALRRSRTLMFSLRVRRGPLCSPHLTLVGAGGRVYARGVPGDLATGRQTVTLMRIRKMRRGSYRLRIAATGVGRRAIHVRSGVAFRVRGR